MRIVLVAVGLFVLAPNFSRADDATDVVDKAVRATANSDLRLNRLQNVKRMEKGNFYPLGGDIAARRTVYLAPPDRIKFEADLTSGGQSQPLILSINGVRGWSLINGTVQNMNAAEFDAVMDEADSWSLVTLLPLRKKGVTLKSLPKATINGKAAVGVNVIRPNRPDAQLFFATDSGLLLKLKVKVREGGQEVGREWDLAEYREFDSIKLPTRIALTQNGRKIEDWTVEKYSFPEKLDDKLFVKPK
jgi:hypothetical protein